MPRRKPQKTEEKKRFYPWERKKKFDALCHNKVLSTNELMNRQLELEKYIQDEAIPSNIQRLYIKMLYKNNLRNNNPQVLPSNYDRLRLSHYFNPISDGISTINFLNESLVGILSVINLNKIFCPYTIRFLKPYIKRGIFKKPPRVRLHEELIEVVKRKVPSCQTVPIKQATVDFLYICKEYIPALNALVNAHFWPYIDVSIVLDYPEFSVIAIYKKIVVGFGFMAPGTHLNEGYIHFIFVRPEWRKCGIAKFILYHLIQTSFVWDKSLHVSTSNPAIFLYQKFGFKVECMCNDFYKNYIASDSRATLRAMYCKLDAGR